MRHSLVRLPVLLLAAAELPTREQADAYATCRRREALRAGATRAEADLAAPPPSADAWVAWSVTDGIALGNSLNVYMNAFLHALYLGRRLVVGSGMIPALLCGPEGVFECGEERRHLFDQIQDWG